MSVRTQSLVARTVWEKGFCSWGRVSDRKMGAASCACCSGWAQAQASDGVPVRDAGKRDAGSGEGAVRRRQRWEPRSGAQAPRSGKGEAGKDPLWPPGGAALPTPGLQHFCCVKTPVCGGLLRQAQDTDPQGFLGQTLGNTGRNW